VAISGLRSSTAGGGAARSGRTGQGVPATAGFNEEAEAGPVGELGEQVRAGLDVLAGDPDAAEAGHLALDHQARGWQRLRPGRPRALSSVGYARHVSAS